MFVYCLEFTIDISHTPTQYDMGTSKNKSKQKCLERKKTGTSLVTNGYGQASTS